MHRYKVTIDFKRGPSYESTLVATHKEMARAEALRDAQSMGWNVMAIKKIAVREA